MMKLSQDDSKPTRWGRGVREFRSPGVFGPHMMTLSSGGPRAPEIALLGRGPGQHCFLDI